MEEFRFNRRGIGRVRFLISPLWETSNAIRLIRDAEPQAYHLPWLSEVGEAFAKVDIEALLAVQPIGGWTPDFLAPIPDLARFGIEEQLDAVRKTPLELVRHELQLCVQGQHGEAPPELRRLLAHPKAARARLADGLEGAWRTLVAPYWKRLSTLLEADIAHHARILADGGIEAVAPALHERVRWSGNSVQVRRRTEQWKRRADLVVELDDRGLVLQPSAFIWPAVLTVHEPPSQPALVYPARRIAELWQPARLVTSAALTKLLGATRAVLLTSLQEPATTTTLAHRHQLSKPTVSEHLKALADAQLINSVRQGRNVAYSLSPLGSALIGIRPGSATMDA